MNTIASLILAALLIGVGVAFVFPPAGFVLAGLLVGAVALLVDDGR